MALLSDITEIKDGRVVTKDTTWDTKAYFIKKTDTGFGVFEQESGSQVGSYATLQEAFNRLETLVVKFGDTKDGADDYVISKTLANIKSGQAPDRAFANAAEDENYHGMRADIVAARKKAINTLASKHGIFINPSAVNKMIGGSGAGDASGLSMSDFKKKVNELKNELREAATAGQDMLVELINKQIRDLELEFTEQR